MRKSVVSNWTIISFVIGTLFGSGAIWQWKEAKLAEQKQELEKIMRITDLRKQQSEEYAKIIALTNEYIQTVDEYSRTRSPQINNRVLQQKAQLDVMKDGFTTLESNLARLEGRQPRRIILDFIPPAAPTGLRVQ